VIDTWRRFAALSRDNRRLIVEAVVLLTVMWIGLRFLPFSVLRRRAEGIRPAEHEHTLSADRIGWAVTAATRRLVGATCLVNALAAVAMLRRHGYTPELRLGVRDCGRVTRPLDAHAWVECEGQVVAGKIANLADYSALAAQVRA